MLGYHQLSINELKKIFSPAEHPKFTKTVKYEKDGPRCTLAVSKYLSKEVMSFHTVEKEPFVEVLKTFVEQHMLPYNAALFVFSIDFFS